MQVTSHFALGLGSLVAGALLGRRFLAPANPIPAPPGPLIDYFDGLVEHNAAKVWENQSVELIEAQANLRPPVDRAAFVSGFEAGFENLDFLDPQIRWGYHTPDETGYWCVSLIVRSGDEEVEKVYFVCTEPGGRIKSIYN